MKMHGWIATGLALGAVLMSGQAQAAPRYRVTDLGTLGGKVSTANAINNKGDVVGQADSAEGPRAFLWRGGKMRSLGTKDEQFSCATDINDKGQIVGYLGRAFAPDSRGFSIRPENLTPTSAIIDVLSGDAFPKKGGSACQAINNAGAIAGYFGDEAEGEGEGNASGFRFTPGKGLSVITTDGAPHTMCFDINNKGEVVGTFYDAGKPRAFQFPSKLPSNLVEGSEAWGINDSGSVAAFVGSDAVRLIKTPTRNEMAILGGGIVLAINARGDMVGNQGGERALLYPISGGRTDLNSAIAPGSGWVLQGANDINDAGQIVGYGTVKGQMHAFLLSPIKAVARASKGKQRASSSRRKSRRR